MVQQIAVLLKDFVVYFVCSWILNTLVLKVTKIQEPTQNEHNISQHNCILLYISVLMHESLAKV